MTTRSTPGAWLVCLDASGTPRTTSLRGESSTHYTKLPTYPSGPSIRMVEAFPRVKLIYVMRHPIDRLASHYLHEQTVGRINVGLEQAVVSASRAGGLRALQHAA